MTGHLNGRTGRGPVRWPASTTLRCALLAGLACVLAAPAAAHDDDPKIKRRIPYAGPGYRRALDGDQLPQQAVGFDADGVVLEAWLPLPEFGSPANGNDCWGYVSPSGREYALFGHSSGTGFVEITDPGNPQVIDNIAGPTSLWRDVKTYGEYAYAVTEGTGAGIQVFDLTQIDAGVVSLGATINTGGNTDTHNVAIDTDSGFLYRLGGGTDVGLRIYDLADPANPAFVGDWLVRYVHDAQIVTYTSGPYAGRQIAFCCSGFGTGYVETGLDILDVTDKQNIVPLARYLYPNGVYSHQAWLSEDRTLLYLNDELDENGAFPTTTIVLDVSDLSNPVQVSTFTNGSIAVGHNLYVRGDFIFEANYRSGLRIFDASDPQNPVEFAYYDTYPDDDLADFDGLWSNYPLFPSGTVIGSDMQRGLWVWRVPALEVALSLPAPAPALVDPAGATVSVQIDELFAGAMLAGSARLHHDTGEGFTAVPMTPGAGNVFEGALPAADCGTTIRYYFAADTADGITVTLPGGAPEDAFVAVAAVGTTIAFENDMESGAGWSVNNAAVTGGGWERGVPAGDGTRGDPTSDADGSGQCWLTENGAGNTDVDGGPAELMSELLDLTGVPDPVISYARWFYNDDNDADRLDVYISATGAAPWTLVESVPHQGTQWQTHTFRVSDFVAPSSTMRLRFTVSDNPNDSVTEAGIDSLAVSSYECGADPGLPGDLTGPAGVPDGMVDALDILVLISQWGSPCSAPCTADITGPVGAPDGNVDALDYLLLISNWTG